jgi:hypothetical protein
VPLLNTKSVGRKWCPPSPLSASAEQWESLFAAASSRLGGYTQRVGFDSKSVGLGDVRFKAPTVEGSPGKFVAVAADRPRLRLLYAPDRLFELFPGRAADTQSVANLQHTGNANPAAAVAELGSKPDVGMTITQKTVSFTKIAALATFSP